MLRHESKSSVLQLATSEDHAKLAGLVFVNDDDPGIGRSKPRKLFRYTRADGRVVRDDRTLTRIRMLGIPPAWSDVWICTSARGHIQATGRDARGRKQYVYHADWIATRDEAKYHRLIDFAKTLPRIRRAVKRHMRQRGLSREKVLATVVQLLETTLIRVGNQEYARSNQSFGLSTLQDKHVSFGRGEVRFKFRGKTGKEWRLKVSDRRIARIVKSCQELPGQHLFQYEDGDGQIRQVSSSDVNDYLREISDAEITAKDFRTWAGTVLAAMALREFDEVDSETAAKRNVKAAISAVASRLGNTPTICRKCYVHPEVLDSYVDGSFAEAMGQKVQQEIRRLSQLSPEEAATLALLHDRLKRKRPKGKARARPAAAARRR